jgi:adenosylhomocysteine nucleosidase
MHDVLLLTPLQEERDALVAGLRRHGHASEAGRAGRLDCLRFPDLALALAIGGHGKAQFAVQTQHLLERLGKVDLVICAGAAGSLSNDVRVGDLVAATQTVEHDYTLRFVPRPLPAFAGHPAALAALRDAHARAELGFALQFGMVASGDEDVICSERARALAEKTGALCVAWEGSGAARACRFSGVPFLELRGITDVADKCAAQHFDENLALAMSNVALLLHHWRAAKKTS